MATSSNNITLHIEGMDCANCALGITRNLEKKGANDIHVSFATGEATFLLKDKKKLQSIINSIHDLGYKVVDPPKNNSQPNKLSTIEKRFYLTLPFTIILFLSHMLLPHDFILNQANIQLLICLPVFIIGIMQFGKSAWGSVKIGVPNMDVLIFIGSTSAFAYSIAGIILYDQTHAVHNYLFFETTATIITLVLLGNVLEHKSVKKTTTALQELSKIQVTTAKLVGLQFGKEVITEIKYEEIKQDYLLQVNTGDKIPVDGEIISGSVSIDEAMLTGESIPVEKTIGHKVIGGTIVLNGSIKMRAENVGEETVLAKIIELVKKAQQSKPQIQKLGDKISAIFVPVVLLISVITFLTAYFGFTISLQQSIMNSIAVLVISCPCAMGLATPTAVMVGIGRAAKNGILIKGGDTLEQFALIKHIIFDKTGTLTTGDFKIKKIICNNCTEEEVKEILFQLEQHSSHPIAKSIIKELKNVNNTIRFSNITEEKGLGIFAIDYNKNEFKIGSYKIAKSLTTDESHNIYVIKNNMLIATIDIEDEVKVNVKESIYKLKLLGIRSTLLSGDSLEKCDIFAKKVGIDTFFSNQSPEQKLKVIETINSQASSAMVGDGINDAPALSKSDVGISFGNSSQIAIQSAQIVLLNNKDLNQLIQAYFISKHTLKTIKQNLFWAFAYNIIAIPIAAMGLLSPMVAALSMAFSDVIVIGNSLLLKSKKLN